MYRIEFHPTGVQHDPAHPGYDAMLIPCISIDFPHPTPPPGYAAFLREDPAGDVNLGWEEMSALLLHETFRRVAQVAARRTDALASGRPDPAADAITVYHIVAATPGVTDEELDGARMAALAHGAMSSEVA
jgi:hypothetical protein